MDVVSRKTIGLSLDDIKKNFELSVKEIRTIEKTLEKLIGIGRKLIIFVDDLDRCSIDNTIKILESIKLLFSAKNTKFVVGADMKMLETAWVLKHKPLIESPYEGKEHLEKIFQLKLSLPSKTIPFRDFYFSGDEKDPTHESHPYENELVKGYLDDLTPNLPAELRKLIADSFPLTREK